MKTKISMKTIYLILVITIGLVGLGIGSTLAVFTASAEISNPISFSSNLSYNGDIFDTVEVTIGPNATRTTNVSIFNDEQIDGVKYAVWYIYEGNSNDISFVRNQESDIDPSGTDIGQGGTLSMDIKNNTSNTITITIGVTTSKEDIVLPSYMKVITLATVAKYNLTLTKGTGISIMYYKINGSNTYASTTNSSITVSVNEGSTYYYYGIASTGYAMNSCSSSSSPCSGTMGASAVTKTLTASRKTYTISYNANGGTGAPSSQTKTYGITLTLSNTRPVKIGYPFLGWTINSNGTGTLYQPGGSFTTNANTTLYAKYSTTLTNYYTVYLDVIDTGESYQNTVKHGDEYSKDISTMASGVDVTCTNGQIPNISGPYNNIVTIYINQVTSNTSCEVQWWDY